MVVHRCVLHISLSVSEPDIAPPHTFEERVAKRVRANSLSQVSLCSRLGVNTGQHPIPRRILFLGFVQELYAIIFS